MYSVGKKNAQQVKLDRCTGHFAIQLRAATQTMERSYERIKIFGSAYKLACATIVACPKATSIANQYLKIEKTIQETVQIYWNTKKAEWNEPTLLACDVPRPIFRSSFPGFPFRIITGTIADISLDLPTNVTNYSLDLELFNHRLKSNAKLKHTGEYKHEWTVLWTE